MKNSVRDERQFKNLLDAPAAIDFRAGERGKYAHRFGEVVRDEKYAADFFVSCGFEVAKIDEDRFAKTPDFRLTKKDELVAYCEVKTLERDVWLDTMLAAANHGDLEGGSRPDPIYNRISNAVLTASRQLVASNPGHNALNLLFIVNRDRQARYEDLVSVLTGTCDPLAGMHDKTHEQSSQGRTRDEKHKIDLYLWLDAYQNDLPKGGRFFFGNYENRQRVCALFDIDSAAVATVG